MNSYFIALQYVSLLAKFFDDAKAAEGGNAIHDTVPLSINGVQGDVVFAWVPRVAGTSGLPTSL